MAAMRGLILSILAVLSGLAFIVLCCVWVRSESTADEVGWSREMPAPGGYVQKKVAFGWESGQFDVWSRVTIFNAAGPRVIEGEWDFSHIASPASTRHLPRGFHYKFYPAPAELSRATRGAFSVGCPIWALVLVSALIPVAYVLNTWQRRRSESSAQVPAPGAVAAPPGKT